MHINCSYCVVGSQEFSTADIPCSPLDTKVLSNPTQGSTMRRPEMYQIISQERELEGRLSSLFKSHRFKTTVKLF